MSDYKEKLEAHIRQQRQDADIKERLAKLIEVDKRKKYYDVERKHLYQHVCLQLICPNTLARQDEDGTVHVWKEFQYGTEVFDKADLITAELIKRADAFARKEEK